MQIKKILITCLIIIMCKAGFSQGIKFEKGLTWDQVKAKAQNENKYIFVDCYATWCAPCKWMAANIFPLEEVGDYYNNHFINVAIQMDQTSHDNAEVRQWYADAKLIEKDYSITEYPTYLYFSPEGKATHRIVGGSSTAKEFIEKTSENFNPGKQYYVLLDYKNHLTDSVYLQNALKAALNKGDQTNAAVIADAYLGIITNPFQRDNIRLIFSATKSTKQKTFDFLLGNVEKATTALGEKTIVEQTLRVLVANNVVDSLTRHSTGHINWTVTSQKLKDRYPVLNNATGERDLISVTEVILKKRIERDEIKRFYSTSIPDVNWNTKSTQLTNYCKRKGVLLPVSEKSCAIKKSHIELWESFRRSINQCRNQ
jgi:thiol-disulfide isomerase/thioredoxin